MINTKRINSAPETALPYEFITNIIGVRLLEALVGCIPGYIVGYRVVVLIAGSKAGDYYIRIITSNVNSL